MGKVILIPKEHDSYIHICGKTGKELEELVKENPMLCDACPKLQECFKTHTVPTWENPTGGKG